jgi:hypothetical protein
MASGKRSRNVLSVGALAVCAFGLAGAPSASSAPPQAPTNHWCPGDLWDPAWGTDYHWNWNQCHDWQPPNGQRGVGWGPWGPPPPWAPPQPPPPAWAPQAHLMWNPTANAWGFFNNGIWTSI